MSKPLGLGLVFTDSGPRFLVQQPSDVEDAIWDAVQLAISHGWKPEAFRDEVADAWGQALRESAKYAQNVLRNHR